ncbi:hypothetical protein GCM10010377_72910 [Streptomyces viridiviolaceus]|nr:hypothetical protein GCM10010377_72910 [Streptomyces viridiviolaceus]
MAGARPVMGWRGESRAFDRERVAAKAFAHDGQVVADAAVGLLVAGSRRPAETTPGVEVVLRVGRMQPQPALAGRVLTDQTRKLDGKIADSEAAGTRGGSAS